eukprot:5699954-Prymnesium_polylepis.1
MAAKLADSGSFVKLYRAVLRAHRTHLPAAHRELGDTYVKAEVRRPVTTHPHFPRCAERGGCLRLA